MKNERETDTKQKQKNCNNNRSRGKNYNGKRNRPTGKATVADKPEQHTTGSNDASWYAINEQLLKDAASVPFSNAIGTGISNIYPTETEISTMKYTIPGICAITFTPGIGHSLSGVSAVNIASKRIYSFVRHMNSGAANYDSPDLMLYLLAMDSMYTTYMYFMRMYGIAAVYSNKNRYLADALLTACGADPEDIRKNLVQLRYNLNVAAAQIATFATPATMSIYKRHAWMSTKVFKDAEVEKAQLYAFVPDGYYVYNEKSSDKGGYLEWKPFSTSHYTDTRRLTVTKMSQIMNEMLQPIVSSEDIGIMSGDILKAYGQDKLNVLPGVPEDFVVIPEYDREVLTQIQNLTVAGRPNSTHTEKTPGTHSLGTMDIYQDPDTNAIIYRPCFVDAGKLPGSLVGKSRLLTLPFDNPTPADVMVATRLMIPVTLATFPDAQASNMPVYMPQSHGTEIATTLQIYCYEHTEETDETRLQRYNFENFMGRISVMETAAFTMQMEHWAKAAMLEKFDYHPAIWVTSTNASGKEEVHGILQDVDNITSLRDSLIKMHDTALLSLFDVPNMSGVTI